MDAALDACLTDALMESVSTGIVVLDADERIMLWSGWMEKASGLVTTAVTGRPLTEVFPELAESRVHTAVRHAIRQGLPSVLSQSLNRSPFPLFGKAAPGMPAERMQQKVQVLPLRPDDERRLCLIEIFDVSQAVHREKVLDQQRQTTRALINATQESALLLDEAGSILAINEIGAKRLGGNQAALLGKNFYTLLPPELAESRRAIAADIFRKGTPAHVTDVRKGIHFDINLYPVFDSRRQVTQIAIYAADVSEELRVAAVERLFHGIDDMILSGKNKQEQFAYICTEVAEIFALPAVWIGQKITGGSVSINSFGGPAAADYVAAITRIGVRWDDTPLGEGPAGSAIRTGQLQRITPAALQHSPWHDALTEAGIRDVLAVPLILRGEVFGCFVLTGVQESSFDSATSVQRITDIASRICVAQERALDHEQLRLLQTALARAANGVFITDKLGRIQWLNSAFVKMTGYSEEEALGATPHLLKIGAGDQSFFVDMLESICTVEAWTGETVEHRKDGSSFTVRQTISPIHNAQGEATHFISIIEDMTVTREAEARIHRLAHYDLLTDLPNRALFNEHCEVAITRAKRSGDRLALMFLDLDHFKEVNDTHGHDSGDLLLQEVARRLTASIRKSDIAARLAGDEFTVLLPILASTEDAALVAEKIISALKEPISAGSHTLYIGVSIGIAVYPQDARDVTGLLKCADTAMYAAKHGGRARYCYFQDMAASAPTPDHG